MEDSHSNSQEKKFRCPKENCDFQTNNANSIPNHIKHMHPTDPAQHPFSCHKCDKTFPYASSLSQHVEKVHLKLKRDELTLRQTNLFLNASWILNISKPKITGIT